MSTLALKLRKFEFEARIFISLSLVAVVAAASFAIHGANSSTLVSIGQAVGLSTELSLRYGYLVVAAIIVILFMILRANLLAAGTLGSVGSSCHLP